MIDKVSIERKDFSVALPNIKGKVGFVADILRGYMAGKNEFAELLDHHTATIGTILSEIEDDLRIINDTLYPETESPETAT
jgi:hypothetical protein